MAAIYSATKFVVDWEETSYEHLYLVYDPDDDVLNGNEYIIRGGPAGNFPGLLGDIVTENGVLIENSEDELLPGESPYWNRFYTDISDVFGGVELSHAWAVMSMHAQAIEDEELEYDALYRNSNSVFKSVLEAAGITFFGNVLPDAPTNFAWPGFLDGDIELDAPSDGYLHVDGFRYQLGTEFSDTLVGADHINRDYVFDGGDGFDTVNYEGIGETQLLITWISDNHAIDSLGNELWNIESIDLGSGDNTIGVGIVRGASYNGGEGQDTLLYGVDVVYSLSTASIYDERGLFRDTVTGFEDVAYNDLTLLASSISEALAFDDDVSFVDFSSMGSGITLSAGGILDRVIGTNHGDTFHTSYGAAYLAHIHTGDGDDTVTMQKASVGKVYIQYSGGLDTYEGTQVLQGVTLAEDISYEDLTISIESEVNGPNSKFTLEVDVAGHGSFTINYDDISGKDIPITLLAGGSFIVKQDFEYSTGYTDYYIVENPSTAVDISLTGTWGDDVWIARSGYGQAYYAKGGDDTLYAGDGNDIIYGGFGSDTLYAGEGQDTLDGGDGDDTLFGDFGGNILKGGRGNDTYVLTAGAYNQLIDGDGSDEIETDFVRATTAFEVDGQVVSIFDTSSGHELIATIQNWREFATFAFAGEAAQSLHDVLIEESSPGGSHAGTFDDDILDASGFGDDAVIYGLDGHDNITGSAYDDEIFGGRGNDEIYGGAGNDTLWNGDGDDDIYGGDGNDSIHLTDGFGYAEGESGNDIIFFGAGVHWAQGGEGADRFVVQGDQGSATIGDFDYYDRIDLTVFESIRSLEDLEFDQESDRLVITAADSSIEFELKLYLLTEESVPFLNFRFFGAPDVYDDLVMMESGAPTIIDVLDNDEETNDDPLTIEAIGEQPTFGTAVINLDGTITYTPRVGFTGQDYFTYTAINGDEYTDIGTVTLTVLNDGGQLIAGTAFDEILTGGSGDDFLYSLGGALAEVNGAGGHDFLSMLSGGGSIDGGSGSDTFELGSLNGNGVVVSLATGTGYEIGYSSDITTLTGVENLMGSYTDDSLTGDSNNNVLSGNTGSDTLDGGGGVDTVDYRNFLNYNSGAVTVNLTTGTATDATDSSTDTLISIENVIGGVASDTITGSSSANVLSGMEGNDILEGGAGDDTLSGGDGVDTAVYSNAGSAVTVNLTAGTATGGDGSDTLSGIENVVGSDYADTITGDAEDNALDGGDGNDTIYSAGGTDNVLGGDGEDEIHLGVGTHAVTGGAGADTYVVQADAEQITITDFDVVNDILDLRAFTAIGSYAELTKTASGSDSLITLDGTIEVLLVGVDYATELSTINYLFVEDLIIDGTSGNDTLNGGSDNEIINGLEGNDIITGGAGDDVLSGGAGNDSLNGGDGFDTADYSSATSSVSVNLNTGTASGGAGSDTLVSIEKVIGSNYGDTLTGGASADTFSGGDGNDTINGGDGNDTIYGDAGTDTLYGNAGNDTIYGGSDGDSIFGGDGDDTLIGGAGNDTIRGEAGTDTFKIEAPSAGFIVYRTHADYLTVRDTNTGSLDTIYTGVEAIQFNDVTLDLTTTTFSVNGEGWGTAVTVTGTSSVDYLNGFNAVDTIYGAGGNDQISGNGGADTLYGGDGNDTINGGNENDTLYGDAGTDGLYGNAGNDILYGGDDADSLNGGDGDDILYGGAGNDTIRGDAGTDTLIYSSTSSGFIVYRNHADYLIVRDTNTSHQDSVFNSVESIQFNDVTLDLTTLTFAINGEGWGAANAVTGTSSGETLTGYNAIDTIYGAGGNDTINGNGGADTLYGGDGNDTINGGNENDIIYGDAGTDVLYGNAGNDTLYGGDDADSLNGGDGDDTLVAGNGANDTIRGDAGTDTLIYSSASTGFIVYRNHADYLIVRDTNTASQDSVYNTVESIQFTDVTLDLTTLTFVINGEGWGAANAVTGTSSGETLTGYNAIDTIYGSGGNDTINGNGGADTLYGGDGNDTINGGNENDTLHGGDGGDNLQGGDGDDILQGDAGADYLTGGAGADRYIFNAADVGTGYDNLSGFSLTDGDILDLRDILSAAYDPLTDVLTDFVEITTSGSNSILKVDVDGGANNFVQIAHIGSITGLTDEQALVTSGHLLAA